MRASEWKIRRAAELAALEARLAAIPEGNPEADREAVVFAVIFIGIPIATMLWFAVSS